MEVELIIKEIAVGPLMANCFIVGCKKTKEAVVIDPGGDADRILSALAASELNLNGILISKHQSPMKGIIVVTQFYFTIQFFTHRLLYNPYDAAIPSLFSPLTLYMRSSAT